MVEIWKDIINFEGLYMVSNLGRIKSLHRKDTNNHIWPEKIRKFRLDKDGYSLLTLWKNNKSHTVKVHRVVASTFIDNPDNKPFVNHIDCVKTNNIVSNLEWVTHKENCLHAKVLKRYAQGKNHYKAVK